MYGGQHELLTTIRKHDGGAIAMATALGRLRFNVAVRRRSLTSPPTPAAAGAASCGQANTRAPNNDNDSSSIRKVGNICNMMYATHSITNPAP
jgi:hypothetical protein